MTERLEQLITQHQTEFAAITEKLADPSLQQHETIARLESQGNDHLKKLSGRLDQLSAEHQQQLVAISEKLEDSSKFELQEVLTRADVTGKQLHEALIERLEHLTSEHRQHLLAMTERLAQPSRDQHLQQFSERLDRLRHDGEKSAAKLRDELAAVRSQLSGDTLRSAIGQTLKAAVIETIETEYGRRHDQLLESVRLLLEQQKRSGDQLEQLLDPDGPKALAATQPSWTPRRKSAILAVLSRAALWAILIIGGFFVYSLYSGSTNFVADLINNVTKTETSETSKSSSTDHSDDNRTVEREELASVVKSMLEDDKNHAAEEVTRIFDTARVLAEMEAEVAQIEAEEARKKAQEQESTKTEDDGNTESKEAKENHLPERSDKVEQ